MRKGVGGAFGAVVAAMLGRAPTSRAMQPFTSLDELLTVPGMQPAWLNAIVGSVIHPPC